MSRSSSFVSGVTRCLLVFMSMGMVGCATLIHGSSQEIEVDSTPSEARVEVDGRPVGATPTTAVLERNREHTVSLYREGYEPHHVTLRPGRSIWATVNILNFFVPGLLIDASTGALHSLAPGTVAPELEPASASAGGSPNPDAEAGGAP